MNIELIPTHRRGIDVTWNCNIKCAFCYHRYNPRKDDLSIDSIKNSILQAKKDGNNYVDLVGPGEPSTHKNIVEIIHFIKENDMKVCLNTNMIISEQRLIDLLEANVDDFLISFHGMENTHNTIVNVKNARQIQEKNIEILKKYNKTFRINCVITNYNYTELIDLANYFSKFSVRIVNFINFNPHGDWRNNQESLKFVTNLRLVEPLLNEAIDILEKNNIGVNVRYYPMCRIRKDLRKNICNDLQVMFDPYEWDYGIMPKDVQSYKSHGNSISNIIECKNGNCANCQIHYICGGINKAYNEFTNNTQTDAILKQDENISDIYFYRKNNFKVFEVI